MRTQRGGSFVAVIFGRGSEGKLHKPCAFCMRAFVAFHVRLRSRARGFGRKRGQEVSQRSTRPALADIRRTDDIVWRMYTALRT